MDTTCPRCGAAAQPGKKFCTSCGAAFAVPQPTPAVDAAPEHGPVQTEPEHVAQAEEPAEPARDETYAGSWLTGGGGGARPDGTATADGPVFEISVEDKPSGVYNAQQPAGVTDESIFTTKPWLVQAICLGFIGLVVLVSLFASVRNKRHAAVVRRGMKQESHQPAGTRPPGMSGPCGGARLEKSLGVVSVQPHEGMNYFPLMSGECAETGSHVTAGPGSRALLSTRGGAKIHVNSNTEISLTVQPGGALSVSLVKGEAFVNAPSVKSLSLALPGEAVTAPDGGKFHLMLSHGTGYITCVSGSASTSKEVALSPGSQYVSHADAPAKNSLKDVPLDKFVLWVNEWKDDFTPPKPVARGGAVAKSHSSEASAAQKAEDEKVAIIEAASTGYPEKIPKDSVLDIVANGAAWAIVVIKDPRENAVEAADYRPPVANLLKKINGHWIWLESFSDYSEDLFYIWGDKYGFDEKAEAELKISH